MITPCTQAVLGFEGPSSTGETKRVGKSDALETETQPFGKSGDVSQDFLAPTQAFNNSPQRSKTNQIMDDETQPFQASPNQRAKESKDDFDGETQDFNGFATQPKPLLRKAAASRDFEAETQAFSATAGQTSNTMNKNTMEMETQAFDPSARGEEEDDLFAETQVMSSVNNPKSDKSTEEVLEKETQAFDPSVRGDKDEDEDDLFAETQVMSSVSNPNSNQSTAKVLEMETQAFEGGKKLAATNSTVADDKKVLEEDTQPLAVLQRNTSSQDLFADTQAFASPKAPPNRAAPVDEEPTQAFEPQTKAGESSLLDAETQMLESKPSTDLLASGKPSNTAAAAKDMNRTLDEEVETQAFVSGVGQTSTMQMDVDQEKENVENCAEVPTVKSSPNVDKILKAKRHEDAKANLSKGHPLDNLTGGLSGEERERIGEGCSMDQEEKTATNTVTNTEGDDSDESPVLTQMDMDWVPQPSPTNEASPTTLAAADEPDSQTNDEDRKGPEEPDSSSPENNALESVRPKSQVEATDGNHDDEEILNDSLDLLAEEEDETLENSDAEEEETSVHGDGDESMEVTLAADAAVPERKVDAGQSSMGKKKEEGKTEGREEEEGGEEEEFVASSQASSVVDRTNMVRKSMSFTNVASSSEEVSTDYSQPMPSINQPSTSVMGSPTSQPMFGSQTSQPIITDYQLVNNSQNPGDILSSSQDEEDRPSSVDLFQPTSSETEESRPTSRVSRYPDDPDSYDWIARTSSPTPGQSSQGQTADPPSTTHSRNSEEETTLQFEADDAPTQVMDPGGPKEASRKVKNMAEIEEEGPKSPLNPAILPFKESEVETQPLGEETNPFASEKKRQLSKRQPSSKEHKHKPEATAAAESASNEGDIETQPLFPRENQVPESNKRPHTSKVNKFVEKSGKAVKESEIETQPLLEESKPSSSKLSGQRATANNKVKLPQPSREAEIETQPLVATDQPKSPEPMKIPEARMVSQKRPINVRKGLRGAEIETQPLSSEGSDNDDGIATDVETPASGRASTSGLSKVGTSGAVKASGKPLSKGATIRTQGRRQTLESPLTRHERPSECSIDSGNATANSSVMSNQLDNFNSPSTSTSSPSAAVGHETPKDEEEAPLIARGRKHKAAKKQVQKSDEVTSKKDASSASNATSSRSSH